VAVVEAHLTNLQKQLVVAVLVAISIMQAMQFLIIVIQSRLVLVVLLIPMVQILFLIL
jgi:hypothetical protein